MTRQNFHKQRQQRQSREVDEGLIVELVQRERRLQPRLGGRKLFGLLQPELTDAGVEIGRDRFFEVLRHHDLLVPPLDRRTCKTTFSRHSLPVFRNLLYELQPTAPDQVWVSDLTYLRTFEGFEYLYLIMDLYSRKIVGYHCGNSLDALACVAALRTALADLPNDRYPIHHSDRGCQYCSHEYVQTLQKRHLPISMTEENHCYENSNAERLNGVLKQEYALGTTFRSRQHARRAVDQAVWLYNHRRPHGSLDNHFPATVHRHAA